MSKIKNIFKKKNSIKMSGTDITDMEATLNAFMMQAHRNVKLAMKAGEELDIITKKLLLELESSEKKNVMTYMIKVKEI